ncbi:MAG: hypothetical protein RL442_2254, partial [Pseudomonadota bacterium]
NWERSGVEEGGPVGLRMPSRDNAN